MKFKLIVLFSIFSLFSPFAFAEDVSVGLEPFPPLIIDESQGYTIQLLKEVEKVSDLKFDIKIMPYNRAKLQLKNGDIELMGHTPKDQETKDFYNYAQELDWSIPDIVDIYAVDQKNLADNVYKGLPKIGTPKGNAEFLSEILEVPLKNFYTANLDNLAKMLETGRIDAIMFERASTQSTITKNKISGIHYRKLFVVDASLGVSKSAAGTSLKKKLDAAIKKVDQKSLFKDYMKYLNLPDEGVVSAQ